MLKIILNVPELDQFAEEEAHVKFWLLQMPVPVLLVAGVGSFSFCSLVSAAC